MIKRIFTICAFIVSGLMLAQTEVATIDTIPSDSVSKNDIMIDPISTLLGVANVSYERHLNEHFGIGVSAMFKFSDYVMKDWLWDASISPYIRYYMGNGSRRGFFLEGFTGVVVDNFTQTTHYTYETPPRVEMGERFNLTGFAIGAGLGGKWITKKNIIFEVSGGVGYQSTYKLFPFFIKGMFGIGYRF